MVLGVFSLVLLNNKLDNKETILDEVKLKDETKTNKKSFAIMIQKEDGTGYDVYEENTWPTEGYAFNSELSGCIDNLGSIVENSLSYDQETNKVTINTGVTSSCYVYFDIKNTCSAGQALSECLIDIPPLGLDFNIIEGDTLYRFSGTTGNEGINNYICLGTTSKCESGSDNMYRIIGVEPSTGYVKAIKQTKYGSNILWDSTGELIWQNSEAYSTMLTWYNSISFKSMIVSHIWGTSYINDLPTTRANAISAETSTSTTEAYVGMLSISDYYLAYREDTIINGTSTNYYYMNNWIDLANNGNTSDGDWTMNVWWAVYQFVLKDRIDLSEYATRPTFYLNSTVKYNSGTGTIDDPFIVE